MSNVGVNISSYLPKPEQNAGEAAIKGYHKLYLTFRVMPGFANALSEHRDLSENKNH